MFKKSKTLKLSVAFLITLVFGQSLAQFEIRKHSINSGGGKMTGGQYELSSSVGQVDASEKMSQGDFSLNGGFWHENNDLIFKSSVEY